MALASLLISLMGATMLRLFAVRMARTGKSANSARHSEAC